jgi:ABC-type multidrug transport system fused ATPase/permease subunit
MYKTDHLQDINRGVNSEIGYTHGLLCLFRDIVVKTRTAFVMVVGLTILNASIDGLRLAVAFLMLPFIGVTTSNPLTKTGMKVLDKLGIEYNVLNVSLLIGATFLLYAIINLSLHWYQANYSHHYGNLWKKALMTAYVRARWRFYLDVPAGQFTSALLQECNRLERSAKHVIEALTALLVMLIYLGLALYADYRATAILIVMGVGLFAANSFVHGPLIRQSRAITGGNKKISLITSEFLRNIKIIKSVGRSEVVAKSFNKVLKDILKYQQLHSIIPNVARIINELVSVITIIATIGLVVHFDFSKNPDSILIVLVLAIRAAGRGTAATMAFHHYTASLASFETVVKIWQEANAAVEPDLACSKPVFQRENFVKRLCFEEVSILHSNTVALNRVSLDIPFGKIIGIAGWSGGGKTTLVDALMRLYPVDSGIITVDGRPIEDYDIASWRQSIGYVPQDTTLIEGTIRDNILLLAPDASEQEMLEAAKQASAHEFIMAQSAGYDTIVGSMGLKLSGGQRQRLALARALLRHPVLVVLDEATSALDSMTEENVMDAIYKLRNSMSVIIVAQRLGTLRKADRIYVLHHGEVVESDTPDELLKKQGMYFKMWQRQV